MSAMETHLKQGQRRLKFEICFIQKSCSDSDPNYILSGSLEGEKKNEMSTKLTVYSEL